MALSCHLREVFMQQPAENNAAVRWHQTPADTAVLPGPARFMGTGAILLFLIVITGMPAHLVTYSATDPCSMWAKPLRPCVPMMIIAACSRSATSTMRLPGRPLINSGTGCMKCPQFRIFFAEPAQHAFQHLGGDIHNRPGHAVAVVIAVQAGPPDIVMDDMEQQQRCAGPLDQATGVDQCRPGALGKIHGYQQGISG